MNFKSDQGSVLFYILIAVVLFAALSYAVANMMRGGGGNINKETAALYAAEIMNYSKSLKDALQYVRISNDCDETEISFDNPVLTGYTHTPVTRDECKIFHPDGGGMGYGRVPTEWLDESESAGANYGEWFFSGENAVAGVGTSIPSTGTCTSGTTCIDLIAFVPYLDQTICSAINEQLNLDGAISPIYQQDNGPTRMDDKFTGTFSTLDLDIDGAPYNGRLAGCTQKDSSGTGADAYFFYQVLLER